MNLAIVHYHLNRGGVARVVENQLRALDAVLDPAEPWRVAILFGGRREGWNEQLAGQLQAIDLQLVEIPSLDYDDLTSRKTEPRPSGSGPIDDEDKGVGSLCSDSALNGVASGANKDSRPLYLLELEATLRHLGFSPDETVVQIHNHSLGKNLALSASVGPLATAGYNLLLQVHDFAEDFRPANYRRLAPLGPAALYPQSPGIHYAVLNGRDRSILHAAGVAENRLHLLPNPVPAFGQLPDRQAARRRLAERFDVPPEARFVLYPVRGIRRKNLGEMLLVGLLSPEPTAVGLTLAPLNPAEVSIYEMWKETAARLDARCRFEVGAPGELTFAENLSAADAIVTTSVAEGFGMVMLESWPAGRVLLGRNLPEITTDFTDSGLRLNWLWNRLDVPLSWVGHERFVEQASAAYRRAVEAFDRPLPPGWQKALCEKAAGDTIDFGDLDEPMQRDVLGRVAAGADGRRTVLGHNPGLAEILAVDTSSATATIDHNTRVVDEQYSLAPSGRRLAEILLRVVREPRGEPPTPPAHGERILDALLDARRFRMIRA